jgi:hypothetical protein
MRYSRDRKKGSTFQNDRGCWVVCLVLGKEYAGGAVGIPPQLIADSRSRLSVLISHALWAILADALLHPGVPENR